jgi:hypothetical protein
MEEPSMANERIPNDPYRDPIRDPILGNDMPGDDMRSPAQLDNDLQVDPELAEGRASGGRIALFAVGIAVILGAVFYGLNNSNVEQARTVPPTQTAQTQPAPAPTPPGMRDVTPHGSQPNSQPGVTTGSASTNRPTPPASGPTGSELDRSANPSAGQSNDNR